MLTREIGILTSATAPTIGAGEARWSRPGVVVWIAVAYCTFFLVQRNLLSQTIAVDDVEQLIAVQRLSLGYRAVQPPLHAWILWIVDQAVGPGLLALTIVKYGFVCGAVILFHGAARRLTSESVYAALATVSLTLIFLIGFKVHRGYTHTAALMFTSAATLYAFVLLRDRQTLANYALFALAAGLGVLSKYNFIGLLIALLAAGLATPGWRQVILDRRFLLSAAIFAAITLPYLNWVIAAPVSPAALVQQRLPGDGTGALAARLAGMVQILESYLAYLLPFIVLAPICFPVLISRRGWQGLWQKPNFRFQAVLFGAGFVLLVIVVLITGVSSFKGRHLHPLLMFTPILVFTIIEHKATVNGVSTRMLSRSVTAYLAVAGLATVATAVALTAGAYQPPPDCGRCRLQRPYPDLAELLRDRYAIQTGTLIAGDEFIGGNLRAVMPDLRVYSLPYLDLTPPPEIGRQPGLCLVVWDSSRAAAVPEALAAFVERVRGVSDLGEAEAQAADMAYRHNPSVSHGFRYILLPPAGDCY